MDTRRWVAASVFSVVAVVAVDAPGLVRSAHAGPKDDIAAKSTQAMESYDLMDYDAAKKLLNQALAIAKKAKLDKEPVVAKVYLELGIAAFAAGDNEGAKVAFLSAVQIDPKIQISVAYKTPDLSKLLDEARAEGGGAAEPGPVIPPVAPDAGDCSSVKGLQHTIIDTAPAGAPLAIEARVGTDITPVKVAVMFRVAGATDFTESKLVAEGCTYKGQIPAAALRGELIHYYVAAFDANGKAIAAKGSSGSPNILEIAGGTAGGAGGAGDGEDPISGGGTGTTSGGGVSGGVLVGGKPPKVMLTVTGGTGFGYVTGNTEGGNMVEACCLGSSLVVLTPELAYFASPQVSIGIAARIGLPLGANVYAEGTQGSSTVAPAGLLRLRYALSTTGDGVRFMGQLGYGVMRNTIKLTTGDAGMDTDIVGQGPLLIGAGIGYIRHLGGPVSFVADLSALAGIAITDKVGTTAVNTGVGADLSIGLALGF